MGPTKSCPFCNTSFQKLGNHLPHCPKRSGKDYSCYLSQKTIDKQKSKPRRKPCPHCGKQFLRLDTHLRSNVRCQSLPLSTSTLASTNAVSASHPLSDNCLALATNNPSSDTSGKDSYISSANTRHKVPFKYPSNAEEWCEADEHLAQSVVPAVLAAATVEEKNMALCDGIYTYFSSTYGTRSSKKPKRVRARSGSVALNKLRAERNQLRSELRKVRKTYKTRKSSKKL